MEEVSILSRIMLQSHFILVMDKIISDCSKGRGEEFKMEYKTLKILCYAEDDEN